MLGRLVEGQSGVPWHPDDSDVVGGGKVVEPPQGLCSREIGGR